MDAKFEFHGGAELQKVLDSLDGKVRRRIGLKALRQGAKPIVKAAKEKAPVKTGRLKQAIGTKALPRNKGIGIEIGVRKPKNKKDKRGAWYGHLIEFGTVKSAARPFLRPAITEQTSNALKAVGKSIWEQIRKEFRL